MSSAAALEDSKYLHEVKNITDGNTNFDNLKSTYLRQFMTDFKDIMDSIFDYKNREGMFKDVVSWYSGIVDTKLKGDKANLAM